MSYRQLLYLLAFTCLSWALPAQTLPPGGTTTWEISGIEEIITFALFDPNTPGVSLPVGLKFVSAREVKMPPIQEYLVEHPEHSEWAFSIVEITRQDVFNIDGRALVVKNNSGIGLWLAPVDASQLAEIIQDEVFDKVIKPAVGSVLTLGVWIPDLEFVNYMRAKGHYGEYGNVNLTRDSAGELKGEIKLDNLLIRGIARPEAEAQQDTESGTQVLFLPGKEVVSAIVLAGSGGVHRNCDGTWTKEGKHPLSSAVFLGPTFLTTYEKPLKGSLYKLR